MIGYLVSLSLLPTTMQKVLYVPFEVCARTTQKSDKFSSHKIMSK